MLLIEMFMASCLEGMSHLTKFTTNGLGKDNCKIGRVSLKFGDLVRLTLETLR